MQKQKTGKVSIMNKTGKIILISLLSAVLGGSSGAVLWAVLKIMDLGMEMLWTVIPERAGLEHSLVYMLAVTLTGGLIIGLWQRRYGLLPEEMPQVMARVKSEGGYPYDRLHILIVSALLPLIFGGVIGPEAGLTGVIAGLCCFVGDRLKYKGDELAALAQTGICATLGVIFNAPLFGIVRNMDDDAERRGKNDQGKERVRLVNRPVRIFIYCMGAAGGMLAFRGLGALTGGGAMGLPRFGAEHDISLIQWAWMPAIIVSAAAMGLYYLLTGRLMQTIGRKLSDHRVISCMIAGVFIAVIGYFLPFTMFSGEHQMGELMGCWQDMTTAALILTALAKVFLVNMCVELGWRGGSIFPVIFTGVCAGYAFAALTGIDPTFAVAAMAAGMYAYIGRKAVMTVAILLLCFPVVYILPIAVSALIASRIPLPGALKEQR